MAVHIQSKCHDVYVARALAIAEKSSFYAVGSGEQSHFRVCYSATSVVVRMRGQHYRVAVLKIIVHVFDLAGIDVRHTARNGDGQIYNSLFVRCRLPHVEHGVANLKRVLRLGARETFGRVLESVVAAVALGKFFKEFSPVRRYLEDFGFVFAENLLALGYRSGIIKMNYDVFRAAYSFESLFYYVLAALREHLKRHVVGNELVLDEPARELVFGLACGGESYFDFLKSDFDEIGEKFELFFERHRVYERLIAVAKIDRAPNGRAVYFRLFRPCKAVCRRHMEQSSVFVRIFHV